MYLEDEHIRETDLDIAVEEFLFLGEFDHLSAIPESLQHIGYLLEYRLDAKHFLPFADGLLLDRDLTELDAEHLLHLLPSEAVRTGYEETGAIGDAKRFLGRDVFRACRSLGDRCSETGCFLERADRIAFRLVLSIEAIA